MIASLFRLHSRGQVVGIFLQVYTFFLEIPLSRQIYPLTFISILVLSVDFVDNLELCRDFLSSTSSLFLKLIGISIIE